MTIDQNTAMQSLSQSLVPGDTLVDGRTEIDRLCFLTGFASLINFYDQNNALNGNWKPFLLKDPVFLLAHISCLRYDKLYSRYTDATDFLEKLLVQLPLLQQNENVTGGREASQDQPQAQGDTAGLIKRTEEDMVNCVNNLFDQFVFIFSNIAQWTYYMQRSPEYALRTYVLTEVTNRISSFLWAMLASQDYTALLFPARGLYRAEYSLFNNYDEIVWKQQKDLQPFWIVLNIPEPAARGTVLFQTGIAYAYKAIAATAATMFRFLRTVLQYVVPEYEKVKQHRSRFPDTTLLRAFTQLMQVQQDEQNSLAGKHLDFYYRNILQQREKPASPDTAYVYASLAKPGATYCLSAGTLFDGGVDANGAQIPFVLASDVLLNPATIAAAYTIARKKDAAGNYSLLVNTITGKGSIQKDQQGAIQSWDTFGSSSLPTSTQLSTGFVFASPLLFLKEGSRTITCELRFAENIDVSFFKNTGYFISTATCWQQLQPVGVDLKPGSFSIIQCVFTLDAKMPAAEIFAANAEGISANWPMLKMVFNSFSNPGKPPLLVSATIAVTVKDVQNLALYSDFGALVTKAPYTPFGPTPLQGSHFIIGSNEVFSKPLRSLDMQFTWDQLPGDFRIYYQPYNDYVQKSSKQQADEKAASQKAAAAAAAPKPGLLKKIGKVLGKIISPVVKTITAIAKTTANLFSWIFNLKDDPTPPDGPYNNICFTVAFDSLQSGNWSAFPMNKLAADGTPYPIDTRCYPKEASDTTNNTLLFSTACIVQKEGADCIPCTNITTGFFGNHAISDFQPDATIQDQPPQFTDDSGSGFIRMTLTGPSTGFGSSIYAGVVTDIALQNAMVIRKVFSKSSALKPPANIPFTPKLVSLSLDYTASQKYNFDKPSAYPLQCFVYSPAGVTKVYDNESGIAGCADDAASTGVLLFPAFAYTGALFINLIDAVIPADISLYFQLAPNYVNGPAPAAEGQLACFYIQDGCWRKIVILSDGTNGFRCSGILKLALEDPAGDGKVNSSANCWIAITTTGEIATYSKTVFMGVNGFPVTRSGTSFLTDGMVPQLAAGVITKPMVFIPQLAATVQPFPSFGGRPAESTQIMNLRVSNRLKTKDRAISTADYYRLINQHFPEIFYSKAVYTESNTMIYLVKAVADITEANAFLPLVTECAQVEIQNYLSSRSSVFASIHVSNFTLVYVQVVTEIVLAQGFAADGVVKTVNDALNLFMSPWIVADTDQAGIDQGISNAEVIDFITTLDGVAEVVFLSFRTGSDPLSMHNTQPSTPIPGENNNSLFTICPKSSELFVPAAAVGHDITIKYPVS